MKTKDSIKLLISLLVFICCVIGDNNVYAVNQNFKVVIGGQTSTYETINGKTYLVINIDYPINTPSTYGMGYTGSISYSYDYSNYSTGLLHETSQGWGYSIRGSYYSSWYGVRLKFKDNSIVNVESSLSTRAQVYGYPYNVLTKLYFDVTNKNTEDIDCFEGYLYSGGWSKVERFYVQYMHGIYVHDGDYTGYYYNIYKDITYIRPPSNPSNLAATGGSSAQGRQITVNWNANGNAAGTIYELEASNNGSSFTNIYTGTSTSFTHGSLGTGSTKYYRVRAKNGSLYSSYTVNVTGNTLTSPSVTRTVTSSGVNSGKIRYQLSWSAVPGAIGYAMWVWDGANYRYNYLGNVTSWNSDRAKIFPSTAQIASWNGTSDPYLWNGTGQGFPASWNTLYAKANIGYQSYSYYNWVHIAALDSASRLSGGVWDGASSVSNSLPDADAPNIPAVPTIGTVTSNSIALSSGVAADQYMTANYPGSGISTNGYNFKNDTNGTESGWTSTSYTFTSLNPNTQYTFRLQAKDNSGNYSAYSSTISKYTLANIPSSPSYVSATQTSMVLNWNTNGNPGSTQYFAVVVPNGADPEITSNWKANSGWQGNISTWTASGLVRGTQYRAYVKAINVEGVKTNWADFGAKWTLPDNPVITANNGGLAWSNTAGRGYVTLSWPAVMGAIGYKVYVFDGYTYRGFDIGNITNWDSRTAKIYPAETTINSYADDSITTDLFNHSNLGLDLRDNPNKLYQKTAYPGYDYDTYTNYWFQVVAYNSSGETDMWAGNNSYTPTLPNRTATLAPGLPVINITAPSEYNSGNWSKTNVNFTITNGTDNGGSGIQKSQYSTNGGSTWTDYITAVTIPNEGTTNIFARTVDNAGNIGNNSTAEIKIDKTGPTGSIKINNDEAITNYEFATLTLTASDSISSVKEMRIYNGATDTGWITFNSSKQWTLVGGNNTVKVKYRDEAGNESIEYSKTIKYEILPTLNTPTLSNEIYTGFDTVLSADGTNIGTAGYRIFYTTKITAPAIIDGGENPGTGWIDSEITGTMNITGTSNVSKTILASTFDNIDWTYVVFKVAVASGTGNWVNKYTALYGINNPDDKIGYAGHNQIIKINETGHELVASNPTTLVNQYGPYPAADKNALGSNNMFKNEAQLKYRLEFDVVKPEEITKLNIFFDYNLYNKDRIQFIPSEMKLQRLNDNGTITPIQTFSTEIQKENGMNRYYVSIDESKINTVGRYFLEYKGQIFVESNYFEGEEQITNQAEIYVVPTDINFPKKINGKFKNRKLMIDTKIMRDKKQFH